MNYTTNHTVHFAPTGEIDRSVISSQLDADNEVIDVLCDAAITIVAVLVFGLVGYALKKNPIDLIP